MKYWIKWIRIILIHASVLALLVFISIICLIVLPNSQLKASSGELTNLKFQRIYDGLASGRITDINQDQYDYVLVY